ncbi:MAG: 3-deoxy-7-phosphoheptulonate synthase [Acidimicrobiia bacterium]|nr:3-deoxy-7-phosphoheptulonate synthase [Acidimicrobiia bacterium]MDH3462626.1 3-deoxy-7-phosphoheptulonate synthase [Acidimicrobiia bacterium]
MDHIQLICVMQREAKESQLDQIRSELTDDRIPFSLTQQGDRRLIVIDAADTETQDRLRSAPGIDRVIPGPAPFRFVGRRYQAEDTVVKVGGVPIGDGGFVVTAGPCAVESREQVLETARLVKAAGATILRGDAYKPRTSPYAFQGLGAEALEYLSEARELTGLPFVAETVDPRDVESVSGSADMIRIGTRNMSNYALLKEVGMQSKPVLLKRGRTATIEEWLDAAEYIWDQGNHGIVLAERGIRTFEPATRNTLDISAVPIVKELSHLPVMVDPSHSAGRRDLVAPLARASIAVGADGVLIDVHPDPDSALVDGDQAILPSEFDDLMKDLGRLAAAMGVDV